MQVLVEHADDLRHIAVPFAEVPHRAPDLIAVVAFLSPVSVHGGKQLACEHPQRVTVLYAPGKVYVAEPLNVFVVVDAEIAQFALHPVEQIGVDLLLKHRLVIKDLEILLHVLLLVGEVQDEGVILPGAGPVEPGEGLHGLDVPELLVHDHRVQKRLVEAGLEFLRDDQDVEIVVELLLRLRFLDMTPVRTHVHPRFGVAFAVENDLAGESDHGFHLRVLRVASVLSQLLFYVPLDLQEVQDRRGAGRRDDHHLASAVDLCAGGRHEGLNDDLGLGADVLRVELLILLDDLAGSGHGNFRILRGGIGDLKAGLVRHVVLQHVEDETLLDRLMHAVDMERMEFTAAVLRAEHFERGILRRGSEREKGQVLMPAVGEHFLDELVLRIDLILFDAFDLRVFLQRAAQIREGCFQLQCAGAGLRGVRLVADDGVIPAVGFVDLLIDDGKLLQRGDDDARAVVDRVLQILRALSLADGLNAAERVIEARDR